ncbi:epoxide hydrolase [Ceratobasidium sp. AG-Ba]|nr:epoxide hydrolase [Ceratobasidium sp. AG-Ba]
MHLNRASNLLVLIPSVLGAYNVKPFKVDLSSKVPHMRDLIQRTKLPTYSVLGDAGAGIPLDWLRARQKDWLSSFDWTKEQAAMNKFNHSTVDIGNITVHFIHQRSSDPKAIPLLLTHGWPGSFYEFHNVIVPLSNPGKDSNISFHVVVPSMPGYGFSSPAPIGWNLNKTGDLFDTLLTKVLGYKTYTACGGDWGSGVTWGLQNNHGDTVQAVLFNGLLPQLAPAYAEIAADPQFANDIGSLTDEQKRRLDRNLVFVNNGNGYFVEQSTRPATIGLALYDNPIGQLAWIGEKFLEWSDPQFGVPPSTITNNTILTEVSLYYLTGTFETSVNTYFQNPNGFNPTMLHAANDVPMGYAAYYYDLQYYPKFYVSKIGNLVYYAGKPVLVVITCEVAILPDLIIHSH